MRVLVIGGTGLIGAHAAVLLDQLGHQVSVGGRQAPEAVSPVASLGFVEGDYARGDFNRGALEGFEAVVFAAGQDVRHVRPEDADADFWSRYQSHAVPELARTARDVGVTRFVQVGSCYHVVRPDLIATVPYVRARRDADELARAFATPKFAVTTLNPGPIVGLLPGASQRRFGRMVQWARGERDDRLPPLFAPPGGTNYMTARSLAEAIAGALERGEPGAAYLVGDENLTYAEYFQMLVDAAGGTARIEVRDEEHPFLPDRMIVPGRGSVTAYEPPEDEVELLGYRRNDVAATLAEMVAACA